MVPLDNQSEDWGEDNANAAEDMLRTVSQELQSIKDNWLNDINYLRAEKSRLATTQIPTASRLNPNKSRRSTTIMGAATRRDISKSPARATAPATKSINRRSTAIRSRHAGGIDRKHVSDTIFGRFYPQHHVKSPATGCQQLSKRPRPTAGKNANSRTTRGSDFRSAS